MHQRYMHVCAIVGSIHDEASFLRQATTYNRHNIASKTTLEKIEVIRPMDRQLFVNKNANSIRGCREVCQ